jgi:hypothetical protein
MLGIVFSWLLPSFIPASAVRRRARPRHADKVQGRDQFSISLSPTPFARDTTVSQIQHLRKVAK